MPFSTRNGIVAVRACTVLAMLCWRSQAVHALPKNVTTDGPPPAWVDEDDDDAPPPPPHSTDDDSPLIGFAWLSLEEACAQAPALPVPETICVCEGVICSVGGWFTAPDDESQREERRQSAVRLGKDIFRPEAPVMVHFGLWISKGLVEWKAFEVWRDLPRHYGSDYQPNPDGPIVLESLEAQLVTISPIASMWNINWPAISFVTKVTGTDERTIPDANFTIWVTDGIGLRDGALDLSSRSWLDVDSGPFAWAAAIAGFLGVLDVAAVFGGEYVGAEYAEDADVDFAGAGAMILGALPPREEMLVGGYKRVITYRELVGQAEGAFLRAEVSTVPRAPRASITISSSFLTVEEGLEPTASARFAVKTADVRKSLAYAWTSSGSVQSPTADATWISWNVAGVSAGTVLNKNVKVTVTDADGLQATDQRVVQIRVVRPRRPDRAAE